MGDGTMHHGSIVQGTGLRAETLASSGLEDLVKTVHKLVDEFDELQSDDRRAMIEQVVSKVVVRQNQESNFISK